MQPVPSTDHARLAPLKKRVVDYRLSPLKKSGADSRLPPLKKGVVGRTAIGGGICFAATPQIPRPRCARPAPFSKGGKSRGDSACEQHVKLRPLLRGPACQSSEGVHHRLPPLKKGGVDRTAIGGGICFATTPQIPRPRCARPAPFSKGGKSRGDSACEPHVKLRPLLRGPACQSSEGVHHRLPPLKKGVVDRTAIGGGICSAASPQMPRPRCARPAPFSKGGNIKGDSARIPPVPGIYPFSIEPFQ
jgi:hypothetical protein